jgi:hypothetical protein
MLHLAKNRNLDYGKAFFDRPGATGPLKETR